MKDNLAKELELHQLVKDFYRSVSLDRAADSPVTVAELNHATAQMAQILDRIIGEICKM